jgi:N utilization substance protein B
MASDNGPRRQAREAALQVLYAIDSGADVDVEKALAAYWANLDGPAAGRPYGDQIVRGVTAKREAIDETLRGASSNWRLERMARIDRNLLRIGLWEMLHGGEVPPQVAIDEAVELARTFGAEGAYAFVNGVLDKIAIPKKA